ncbi:MAG: tetratricopeptide repeat protein [Planctomycetota bacterium]
MNFKKITTVLTLAAATVVFGTATDSSFARQQQQQQNQQQQQGPGVVFAGDGLRFEVWGYDEPKSELGGYLVMGQNQYPFLANVDFNNGQLNGKFAVARGEEYTFTGQLTQDGSRLTFTTGGKIYNLVNDAIGQSQNRQPDATNPLDQGGNAKGDYRGPDAGGAPAGNQGQTPDQPRNFTPDYETGWAALEAGDGKTAHDHLSYFAMEGDVDAAAALGVMFHYGQAGVAVDGALAARYYEIAAKQNDPQALGNLGILYRDGIGVAKNADKSSEYLGRAANLNEHTAQLAYGALFWVGDMVKQDDVEAIAWWIIAAENGNGPARENLDEIQREVSADVMQKARTRAEELRNQIEKIMQIDAAAKHQRALDDIRNLGPASNLAEIEDAFAE